MKLPTEEEINIHNSLDEIAARDHFANKTLEQAEAMFRENGPYYQEDLMWMGPVAFAFYLRAAVSYVKSDAARGDAQFIDSLYAIAMFRAEHESLAAAGAALTELADYVIANYGKFDVDEQIHGELLLKYRDLRRLLEAY